MNSGQNHRPSLVFNAMSNWGPLAVNLVIGFLLTPFLIANLGDISYGIWALAGSFVGYYGLLHLGVGSGIMRYAPYYRGQGRNQAVSETITTGMALFMAVALAIFLFSFFAAEKIAHFLDGGVRLTLLVRLTGLAASLECPMLILDAAIRSNERWVVANVLTIIKAILRAIGLTVCIFLGYGVISLGVVLVAVNIFILVASYIMFRHYCPDISLNPALIRPGHARALLGFGILVTITTLATTLRLPCHNVIIGRVMSLEMITLYAPAVLIMKNVRKAVIAPIRVLWPRFAYLDGGGNKQQIATLFIKGTQLSAIFAAGMVFMVFMVGPAFIKLWVGERFVIVVPVLMILAGGYLVETSFAVTGSLLGGTGRQKAQAIVSAIEATIGIGLSVVLSMKWGLAGVALGFLISAGIMQGIVLAWYVCYFLKINLLEFYGRTLLKPYLLMGGLVFFLKQLNLEVSLTNWLLFIVMSLAYAGLYTACAYLFAANYILREDIALHLIRFSDSVKNLLRIKPERQSSK